MKDHIIQNILPKEDTNKITRIEVIDLTRTDEQGGGRVYTYWNEYDEEDSKTPKVEVMLQDDGRTLKVFIN